MSLVNVDRLFLAPITKDETGVEGLVFGVPEYIPSIQQFDAKVKSSDGKLYAEGKLWEQSSTLEDVAISLDLADLTNSQYAKYLGHKTATEGGVISHIDDVAPYVALLVEATKFGGKKVYKVFYKGMLAEPDDSVKGREGKTDHQNRKVTATFQALKNNGMWKYSVDEDDTGAPKDLATSFFTKVIIPTVKAVVVA